MKKLGRKIVIFNLLENVKFFDSICEGYIFFFVIGFVFLLMFVIFSEEEYLRYIMSFYIYLKFELFMWIICFIFSGDVE